MKLTPYLFLFFNLCVNAQIDSLKIEDTKYREDQFYISVTYNLLENKPMDISQDGFSTGFHLGFIRDFPINKNRNIAIGIGAGLSSNSYNQNMQIVENDTGYLYSQIDETVTNLKKNKFTNYLVELPIELRWRNSTVTRNKFWRIYPGFKLGYVLYNSSRFETDTGSIKVSQNAQVNNLQYGATLSMGYGTWNFHCYYGLNKIFNEKARFNNISAVDMQFIKIGVVFYIL